MSLLSLLTEYDRSKDELKELHHKKGLALHGWQLTHTLADGVSPSLQFSPSAFSRPPEDPVQLGHDCIKGLGGTRSKGLNESEVNIQCFTPRLSLRGCQPPGPLLSFWWSLANRHRWSSKHYSCYAPWVVLYNISAEHGEQVLRGCFYYSVVFCGTAIQ